MLGKLMKYEWKAISKRLLPVLIFMVSMSVIATLCFPILENANVGSVLLEIVVRIAWVVYCISFLVVGVVTLIMIIERFNSHVLGREGYFTMTLPVTSHQIVWSKLLVSFAWFFIIMISVFAALSITFVPHVNLPGITEFKNFFMAADGLPAGLTVFDLIAYFLEFVLYLFVCVADFLLLVYASLMIGQQLGKFKIAGVVIAFVLLNSLFTTAGAYLLAKFDQLVLESHFNAGTYFEATHMHPLFLFFIFVSAVPGIVCYFLTIWGMNRHLNLQ